MLLPVAARGLLVPAISGNRLSRGEWWKLVTAVLGFAAFVAAVMSLAGPLLVGVIYGPAFKVKSSLTVLICAAAFLLSVRVILETMPLVKIETEPAQSQLNHR